MSEDQHFKSLNRCLEETGLGSITPQPEALKEALSIDGTMLGTLSAQKISSLIFTLTRYQLYLQLQSNMRTVKRDSTKRRYELELGKTMIKLQKSKLTVKEKAAQALEDNPNLAVLEENWYKAESEATLFHKTPEMVMEIANALKKELSVRGNTGQ